MPLPNPIQVYHSLRSLPPFTLFNVLLTVLVCPISGALLTAGLLSWLQPSATWVEVNSQIVTALFTYLILTECPRRFKATYYLTRARRGDSKDDIAEAVLKMKQCYAHADPNERGFLVFLGFCHLHTFLQVPINVMMWGFPSTTRPGIPLYLLVGISCLSGFGTGLYDGMAAKKVVRERQLGCLEDGEGSEGSVDTGETAVMKEKKLKEEKVKVVLVTEVVGTPEKVHLQ